MVQLVLPQIGSILGTGAGVLHLGIFILAQGLVREGLTVFFRFWSFRSGQFLGGRGSGRPCFQGL